MQQVPDIEKTDSKKEKTCLKLTISNSRRKICVKFQTDTDKFKTVVYCHRNSLYLKNDEVDLKTAKHQSLMAKRVYLLSYFDIIYEQCIVLDETTVHN